MTKKYVFRKGLVIGIIILFVGASVVPSISGNLSNNKESTNSDDVNWWTVTAAATAPSVIGKLFNSCDNSKVQQNPYNMINNTEQDLEIKIMGPFTNPYGYLVYCEIINHGPDIAYVIPDMELYTLLTNEPISDHVSLPVDIKKGEIYSMAYTHSWWFGFGLGRLEVTIDGWGEDEGLHIEKNAYCLRCGILVLFFSGAN